MAGIVGALALPGGAERLAGIAREHRVDPPAPVIADEGSHIAPHRGRSENTGALGADDGVLRVRLPFDEALGVKARLREPEPEVEPSGPGA